MRQLDEEIVQMTPEEFKLYINFVEIPHTETLNQMKNKIEKDGN